jgi:thiamine-monophosphate kinase
MIQDVHFSLDTTPWRELGWKVLAVNLSDIAAMGGKPGYALISLALPGHTEVDDVSALYKGVIELAEQFGVNVVGGDTCRAPLVAITITVLGSAGNKDILTRSAAKPGDMIAVTGSLGGAAGGLEMLTGRLRFDVEATASLRDAFLRPMPRMTEGQMLVEQGVKAAIDISDGLISDLGHICKASRVSARVEVECVPVHPAVRANFGDKALEMALAGGEDYELLFTASSEIMEKVKAVATCPIAVVGEIMAGEKADIRLVDKNGKPFSLSGVGWEHFKEK